MSTRWAKRPPRSGSSKAVRVAFVLLLGLAVIAAFLYVVRRGESTLDEATKPQEEIVDLGAVVTHIKSLNRLETASMRISHIANIKQSYHLVPDTLGGDELTLLAAGDVIAGIDLSKLDERNVTREANGGVVIHLPAPEILVTRIDNNATRVINRKTGMLRREDPDLESRLRAHVEDTIKREAVREGILGLAQNNGERVLAELLHTLGFRRVRFIFARSNAPR
jgi:hypothetical protein